MGGALGGGGNGSPDHSEGNTLRSRHFSQMAILEEYTRG